MPPVATEFIIYVSTNEGTGGRIESCDSLRGLEKSQDNCNNFIQEHGLNGLNVVQETHIDDSGNTSHWTVGAFGK